LQLNEGSALQVDAGVGGRGWHEQLRPFDDVVLARVVFHKEIVVVSTGPVADRGLKVE